MRYVTANRAAAAAAGLLMAGRITLPGGKVVLNEKEIEHCAGLTGSFDERVAALQGEVRTHNEIINMTSHNKKTRQR